MYNCILLYIEIVRIKDVSIKEVIRHVNSQPIIWFDQNFSRESAAIDHFSVYIFFGQVDNKGWKNKFSSIAV